MNALKPDGRKFMILRFKTMLELLHEDQFGNITEVDYQKLIDNYNFIKAFMSRVDKAIEAGKKEEMDPKRFNRY